TTVVTQSRASLILRYNASLSARGCGRCNPRLATGWSRSPCRCCGFGISPGRLRKVSAITGRNMNAARENILGRVRAALRTEAHRPPLPAGTAVFPAVGDLEARFRQEFTAVRGEILES